MSDKREIKFRAWNGKKMRYEVSTNANKYATSTPVRKGYQWFSESNDIHDSKLMQYTGLKDKNGVEIYADDLLEDVNGELIRVYQVDGGFIVKAKYWSANCKDLTWDDELIYQPLADIQTKQYIQQNTIVVGNIYENKDLLT